MACWRVLELSDDSEGIPQLLIKTEFGAKTYSVFLTDLNNIWSEELDLAAIVERATKQESPIEISKQDTTQLAILLENVRKSLSSADDTSCRITRDDADGLILNATTSLPEPLDSLRWKFYLEKRTSVTLRNELILPLLASSHIQHERINDLINSVTEKDKAIGKMLGAFESSNLDLATAFPSISGSKPGRRLIKREQAARHVPALQPFQEDAWKKQTGQLKDSQISTLGLFQEALSECTLKVPPRMKAKDEENSWWTTIGRFVNSPAPSAKSKRSKTISAVTPQPEPSEDETEDEFETHEHFNQREPPKKSEKAPEPTPPLAQKAPAVNEDDPTEDEDDLDAPPRSQRSQARPSTREPPRAKSPDIVPSPPPTTSAPAAPKSKGFRIGGAKKPAVVPPSRTASSEPAPKEAIDADEDDTPIPTRSKVSAEPSASTTAKPARKPFKIGGKKAVTESKETSSAALSPPRASKSKESSVEPAPRQKTADIKVEIPTSSPVEEREETPEEKAERKRKELKRKNEELAKKQAQSKKKKRF